MILHAYVDVYVLCVCIVIVGHGYTTIRPDPSKIDEIKKLPSPTNITDLQKVLGIITYMTPFISHLSDLIAPMRNLLKKETEYKWTTSHQRALQKIKDLICK